MLVLGIVFAAVVAFAATVASEVRNFKSSETVIEAKQEANMGFRDGEGEPMGLSGMREQMMLLFLFNIKTSDIHYI